MKWSGSNLSITGMKPPSGRKGSPNQKQKAEEKFIESSQNNFFGFNTETVKDRSLFSGLLESVKYLYESIIEDYMGDVFTDVIEGYTSATIRVIQTSISLILNNFLFIVNWLVHFRVNASG